MFELIKKTFEERKKLFFAFAFLFVIILLGAYLLLKGGSHVDHSKYASYSTKARSGVIAVKTVKAKIGDFVVHSHTIGFVEPITNIAIRPRMDSQIVEQYVKEGQNVDEGDLLFRLDDREVRAQIAQNEANLMRDRALLERTRLDLIRKRDLADKNASSQQQVDQAVADEAAAKANVQSSQATLDLNKVKLSYAEIKAPISGRVGEVSANKGAIVKAGDSSTMLNITKLSPIWVSFSLPEQELKLIKREMGNGMRPEVKLLNSIENKKQNVLSIKIEKVIAEGKLDFLDSSLKSQSGTITGKALFQNDPANLWPGQYFDVSVEMERFNNIVIVPEIAVQFGQKGAYVYVVTSEQNVEMRAIKLAATEDGFCAISDGVSSGDRVVIEGQLRLFDGAKVREQHSDTDKIEINDAIDTDVVRKSYIDKKGYNK